MVPGLWDNLANAWNGTVGTTWNGITNLFGDSNPPAVNPVNPNANEENPVLENSPEEISQPNPVMQEDYKNQSLNSLLHLLRIEAISHATSKAKKSITKLQEVHDKNKALTKLLEVITNTSEKNGRFEAKDAETKRLLAQAKQIGVSIDDEKTSYTKDERDSLVRGIELQSRNLDVDIKMLVNETQEARQQRDTFYQELKTCWDKIIEAVRKLIQAMAPR